MQCLFKNLIKNGPRKAIKNNVKQIPEKLLKCPSFPNAWHATDATIHNKQPCLAKNAECRTQKNSIPGKHYSINSSGGREVLGGIWLTDISMGLIASISTSSSSVPSVISSTITAGRWGLSPWSSGW